MASLADFLKHIKETSETLSKGYPRARGFADALMANVERNVPTTQELRNPDYMQQRALNYMSPMAGAIKAYHGSPHEFDHFDMSKIGTGEGAQAYGYGLYFAENPNVAETYYSANNPSARHAFMMLEHTNGNINKAIKKVENDLKLFEQHKDNIMPDTLEKYQKSLDILKAKKFGKELNLGNMYDVDIKWPDAAREAADPLGEHHLLDWDKPLSEQPEAVQKSLAKFDPDMYHIEGYDYDPNDLGQSIYGRISQYPEKTSKILKELGIPGIKYLDQGSRVGGGTSNYVMFGDEYPQIVNQAGSLAQLLKGKK